MEPTTRSNPRPEQQQLAFAGPRERESADEVQPGLSSDPNVLPAEPLNGYPAGLQTPEVEHSSTPLWLQRAWLIIYVVFCIELGMLLAVLPWIQVWNNNSLLTNLPTLRAVLHHNFVRGLISGLGVVDVWLGIWEAVHYRGR